MNTTKFINVPFHIGQINALTEMIRNETNLSKPDPDRIAGWTRTIDDIAELIFNNIPYEVQ